MIAQLAKHIAALQRPYPVRVAIESIDAADKTMLADALTHALKACGRVVIRASIDGFHRPRAERYQRGDDSPLGYYEDSRAFPNPRQPSNPYVLRLGNALTISSKSVTLEYNSFTIPSF